MAKRKRRKDRKNNTLRTIPKSASPVRFLIFLTIGVILFFLFFFFVIVRSGNLTL
jgi:hypothetical protein